MKWFSDPCNTWPIVSALAGIALGLVLGIVLVLWQQEGR